MRKNFFIRLASCLVIISFIICISGCDKRISGSEFLLNTIVDVTLVSRNETDQAMHKAFGAIGDVDILMSPYNRNSEVVRINENAGKSSVRVGKDTFEVIKRSIEFSKMTDGAFDISIAPIVEFWGFRDEEEKKIPSERDLQESLNLVNYRDIMLDDDNSSVLLRKKDMKIDLGAIAIGYAVDKAIDALKKSGIENALINAGGEIYALGSPPKRKSWRIGIQHPRRRNELLGTIDLKNKAVSTSGDYENYFEKNGKRYSHIINAKTGKPVEGVMSVTIVADNTTDADALSTALMLVKPDKAMKLVEQLNNVECLIVTGFDEKDMKILISKGLEGKVSLISN